ncbi:transglycosylase domain-containing protein [Rhodoligotrophos defluvii]|uniref:transglycosylase domain-containing protein n=1 Tax=Rhodoligotrophos defluvii TaxID=2561934 RepID=UPI0010C9C85A|nr:PBP1A family penicillin-binding protein [Rhodoligotrophos defluvii]
MSKPRSDNVIYRFFFTLESWVGSALYEFGERVGRMWDNYAARLSPLKVSGLPRAFFEVGSDALTLGLIAALGILYYALPPFTGTGDIWNRGREYAVTFTDASGQFIGRRGVRQDDNIALEEIPPHVIKAVLATEDARFFTHVGVDVLGTMRALISNLRANDVVQGGSTLTQQLAKNLFLSPERTFRRKINEAFLALWIETRLTKPEILKLYLDRSYLGGGTYGVEAAAQFYFGKSIRDVNLPEAAMLAGLFKAPSTYAPHVHPEAARARANVVLHRMLDAGYISQGELFAARRAPAESTKPPSFFAPDYFLDYAYSQTLRILQEHNLTGEYVIEVRTTIDIALQKHAQKTINDVLATEGQKLRANEGALVAMRPDGAVKAIVGGRDYEQSQFNRATDARRQPGSSFKPLVYLAALRAGFHPDTIVYDTPVSIGGWTPKNYTRKYTGRTTLAYALRHSLNTIPVQISLKIGRKPIIEVAQKAGITSPILSVASLPLGTNEVTVMELTTAYATFANGGKAVTPYTVLEIRRPNGDLLYSRAKDAPPAPQVFDPVNVADLNYMLNQVITQGTGRRAQLGFTPQAGKTGTTQDYRDAWFMGFTAQYVTGVWFGNDDYSPMDKVTGGSIPATAWKMFMDKALETQVAAPLPGIPLDNSYAAYVARRESQGQKLPPVVASGSRTSKRGGSAVAAVQPRTSGARQQRQMLPPVQEAAPRPQPTNVFQRIFGGLFGGRQQQRAAPPPPPPVVLPPARGNVFQGRFQNR